jgi:hypothetical protein
MWKQWMKDLVVEYRQGPAAAKTWLKRAQAYLDKDKLDKAEAALKKVLLWVPDQPDAQLLLARTYQRKKDDDRALYHLFLLRDQGTATGPVLEEADKLMASLDPIRGEREATEFDQRKAVLEHSARLAAKDFPKAALLELKSYQQTYGRHADVDDEVKSIEKQGVSLRQRASLFRGDSFPNWEGGKALAADGTSVTFEAKEFARTVCEHGTYAPPFQVRLESSAIDGGAIFGLVYGWRGGERGHFVAWHAGKDTLLDGHYEFELEDDGGWVAKPIADVSQPAKVFPRSEITFTFTEDTLKVSAADHVLFMKKLEPGVARGQIGLVLQEGKVTIKKLEIER